MERGKYVETGRGQAESLGKRRMCHFRLSVEQQPQSKNIGVADAVAFQQAVAAQLDKFGASAYTGSVFLQLEFTTASRTPPAIYKLPKNYLDLLETPRVDAGIERPRLLYKNDRQVKGLIVRYRLSATNTCRVPRGGVLTFPARFRTALDASLIESLPSAACSASCRCASSLDNCDNSHAVRAAMPTFASCQSALKTSQ